MTVVTILNRPAHPNGWASEEYADGRRQRKVGAILHIMVGWLPGTTAHFQNPETGYSTSLGVGTVDGRDGSPVQVHRYVPADGYAFGSYNEDADRRGESIEMAGIYTVTREVLDVVAELLVDLMIAEDWPLIDGRRQFVLGDFPDHRFLREDIPGFGVDFNLITHRSMAEKNCPNDADLGYLLRKADTLLADRLDSIDPESEEDEMKPRQIHYRNAKGQNIRALLVPGTGYFVKWVEGDPAVYANGFAANMETGNSTLVTESLFNVFEREAMVLRPKDALSIELADAS